VVGSAGFDVFSSQPFSPIKVLEAFLADGMPLGRKGARGVYWSSAPLDTSSTVLGCSCSDSVPEICWSM
jgi:hypothetical protein